MAKNAFFIALRKYVIYTQYVIKFVKTVTRDVKYNAVLMNESQNT